MRPAWILQNQLRLRLSAQVIAPARTVIFVMVLLGVVLRFFQELRADNAAEKLKAMVSNTATVVRGGDVGMKTA